jgi:hypothetical protein
MIHGTTAVEPDHSRERRFQPRMSALAFERFEQRGLLATYVCARPRMDVDVAVESRAENVFAQIAAVVSRLQSLLQNLQDVPILAANVDVIVARPQGVSRDDHPLDHLVRVVAHQVAVFARARLRFVGVADDILRPLRFFRNEAPLQPGRKPRAAATAKGRLLDLFDDLIGRELFERFGKGLIAAVFDVNINVAGATLQMKSRCYNLSHGFYFCRHRSAQRTQRNLMPLCALRCALWLYMNNLSAFPTYDRPAMISSTRSGVTFSW